MAWTIQPFQNTDLHNIYEAIVAGGGGGGDALAGLLLDGAVEPTNIGGFYPLTFINMAERLEYIKEILQGTFPLTYDIENGFGWYLNTLTINSSNASDYLLDLDSLFNGVYEPSNQSGFYPLNIGNIAAFTSSTSDNTNSLFKLLTGNTEPQNYSGFYPDTLYKISENTSATNVNIEKSTKIGTTSGTSLGQGGGSGYASPSAAAVAAVTFMNDLLGTYTILNLTFMDGGGANNHSWVCVYRAG